MYFHFEVNSDPNSLKELLQSWRAMYVVVFESSMLLVVEKFLCSPTGHIQPFSIVALSSCVQDLFVFVFSAKKGVGVNNVNNPNFNNADFVLHYSKLSFILHELAFLIT